MVQHRRGRLAVAGAAFAIAAAASPTLGSGSDGSWPMYAGSVTGTRHNTAETTITASNVTSLRELWRYRAPGGPVYGTPAAVDGVVYAADVAGFVFALDQVTGATKWVTRIDTVTAYPFQLTSSPLVTASAVVVGDLGGTVHAFDRATGDLLWKVVPNPHGAPAIWGSPSFARVSTPNGARDLILVPVASNEETYTPTQQQPCCSSRGSVAALDPATGATVWQAYMVTDAEAAAGASGASIWTMPTYDAALNLVYVATGNNFANTDDTPTTDTSDAIVAVNAATGAIVWKNQRTPDDTWTVAYPLSEEHPDADFGDSPQVFTLSNGRKVVAAGQKSGFLHLLDAATGALLVHKQFLPGGGLGGFFADSGVVDNVIVANGNDWPDYGGGELGGVVGPISGADPVTAGHVVAVRASSGSLTELWRFVVPGSPMIGAVAITNGIVFVQATAEGSLYALDLSTGAVRVKLPLGPSVNGPAISKGRIFAGFGDVTNLGAADPTQGGVAAFGL